MGCADYLKKPFNLEELWLRAQQLLDGANKTKIALGDSLTFDVEAEQLYSQSEIVKLTKIQRKILKLLIENRKVTITYSLLISEVWHDFYIKENTIASHIRDLRRLLPEGMIQSVRAEGYRLNV